MVGTGIGVGRKTGLGSDDGIVTTGWVPLAEYPLRMAEIDVGVVPLEPTAFNHAKSWLKGLEFAALGVPFVASPTDPYQDLCHSFGLGILADGRKDWTRKLRIVVQERQQLGDDARNTVDINDLTIERRYESWLNAWTKW